MILGLQTGSLKKELQRQVRRNPNLTFSELLREAKELEREGWAGEGDGLCHEVFTVPPADDLAQWKDQTRAELLNMVTELKQALKDEIVNAMQNNSHPKAVPEQHRFRRPQTRPRWDEQGQVDGVLDEESSVKPSFIGKCPTVEVLAGGANIPCILDTGSQVTLFSETFLKRHFKDLETEKGTKINWLKLKAANGLNIPYVGYIMLDFKVGGVDVPQRGVLIVSDDCMGPDQRLLGMNVIPPVWEAVEGGAYPGLKAFKSTVPPASQKEWEMAFACCQRVLTSRPTEVRPVTARLTKQQPVMVPAGSEMVLWAHIPENIGKMHYTALVEGLDTENEWKVAHAVVEIKGNKLPIRLCNPHPYPIEIPQRQPLAKVSQISPEQIDTNDLVLQVQADGEMEVTVRAIQETAEDCTSGGAPHCLDLPKSQKESRTTSG
ncbi:Ribosome-releasing factor 2 mitochondrial [Dissostichus eleginoides]|uniref:Ribosome-releasing factor 2 mitochondrial n=1 Tax=Dissostichus eleginoides TaxID=100907 RepID=A0AAD9F1M1_DISEL|nr:Ribosome-releasing factor 2 mitochondrial [Dissostichus eleginoides]